MRARLRVVAALCAAGALVRCSLIDNHFNECAKTSDCKPGFVCANDTANPALNFCVPDTTPVGCNGVPDAGILATYGDVDGGVLHFGATINFTSSTGVIQQAKVEDMNAIAMALNEINVSGQGTGQQTFVLHVCDTAGDTNAVATQVQWLMSQRNVQAIIVPGSGQVTAAAKYTIPAGVVIMSPTATSPSLTSLNQNLDGGPPLFWRTCPSDNLQGEVIAGLLMGTYNAGSAYASASQIALAYTSDLYGTGLQSIIQQKFDGGPARTLTSFEYTRDAADLSALINAMGALAPKPQVTILIGYPEDVPRIINAAVLDAGLSVANGNHWLFTDSAESSQIIAGVSDFSQIATAIGTAPAQGAGPAYSSFSSSFKSQFGGVDPGAYSFTSQSYDAMYLLALGGSFAVGANGASPFTGERIAQGLTQVATPGANTYLLGPSQFIPARTDLESQRPIQVQGASGPLAFDPTTGESPAPIEIWGITDAGIVQQQVVQPPSN
jgi:branched-chain amino acid transport system substrate-binding protein